MIEEILIMKDLTKDERLLFQTELAQRRKDVTTGVLPALFLGGFGAHHFYMGRTGLGLVYIPLAFILVSPLIALIETFFMGSPQTGVGRFGA